MAANEPFNFLNLDLYAQDTWKVTTKLTWTFGVRDTLNSNPLNPHEQMARLRGSFDSISHDVNQPLERRDPNPSGQSVLLHAAGDSSAANGHRVAVAPHTVLRSGFGLFSDILPGSVADVVGANPPSVRTFQGGFLDRAGPRAGTGGCSIAPGVPNSAVDATVAANQAFTRGLRRAGFPARLRRRTRRRAFLRSP